MCQVLYTEEILNKCPQFSLYFSVRNAERFMRPVKFFSYFTTRVIFLKKLIGSHISQMKDGCIYVLGFKIYSYILSS